MGPQLSPSTIGVGIVGPWSQASEIQSMPIPSPTGCPTLQESAYTSSHTDTAYDSQLPLPPTAPASPTAVSTPGSSGVSTSTSPERHTVATPLPTKRRLRSAPYARPTTSDHRSIQCSPVDPTGAVALDHVRNRVQQFITDHPHAIEPCIGDPAAVDIIGSNPRLGTPGKSIYTVFFYSSRSGGKLRFNCHDCTHVDARFSRALRHQRQDHFRHSPFPCQGGTGHPAW